VTGSMDAELPYFEQARTFTDNKGPINSIDFHRKEDLVVTAGAWRAHTTQSPADIHPPRLQHFDTLGATCCLGFSSLPAPRHLHRS